MVVSIAGVPARVRKILIRSLYDSKTNLFRQDDGGPVARFLLNLIGRTSEVGARALISAVAAGGETHGRYLSECQVKPPSSWVRSLESREIQVELWQELMGILDRVEPGIADVLI